MLPHEELLSVVDVGDRDEPAQQPDDRVRFRIDVVLALGGHADPGEDQERAEHVDDPVELLNQVGAGDDHRAAHHQRAENAPEQHAMLIAQRDAEEAEDQDEHEDVVDRERLFNQVAGEVLEAGVASHERIHAGAEQQRQRDPHTRSTPPPPVT